MGGKLTGYSRRALVETAFARMKTMFGGPFFSKRLKAQKVEGHLKCCYDESNAKNGSLKELFDKKERGGRASE